MRSPLVLGSVSPASSVRHSLASSSPSPPSEVLPVASDNADLACLFSTETGPGVNVRKGWEIRTSSGLYLLQFTAL